MATEENISADFVCEPCDKSVNGGYDQEANQVLICSNTCNTQSKVEQILTHELIHMYDFCTAKLDLENEDHLACTEIRAANLVHCNSELKKRSTRPGSHGDCVKDKAAKSVSVIRGVPQNEALRIVQKNFAKCYPDLEPIGRRAYNWDDSCRALTEYLMFSSILAAPPQSRK